MPIPPTVARRRGAAVLVTAFAAGTLGLPVLAQPASAADPTTDVQVVLALNGSTGPGIYSRPTGATDASSDKVLVAPSRTADYSDLVTSADGSRFAYVATLYPAPTSAVPDPAPNAMQVVVRDISGNVVRIAEQVDLTAHVDTEDLGPALSPDGGTVVWNHLSFTSTGVIATLRKVAIAGGSPVTIASNAPTVTKPAFLDATTLLITDRAGKARTLPVTGGNAPPVTGLDDVGATDFDISPDGLHIAWSVGTTPKGSSTSTADVKVADLATSRGAATVSHVQTFATGQDNRSPSFSGDSASLSFVHFDGYRGDGDIRTGPVSRSTAPVAAPATPGVDEFEVDGGAVDTVAPTGAPVPGAVTLNGTSTTLRWQLPAGSDVSGVRVSRNGTPVSFLPGTSGEDVGLTVGTEYDYTLQAVDRSGNVGPASTVTQTVATAAPALTVSDPTSSTSASTPFTIGYGAIDRSGTVYSVDYRNVATTNPFTRFTTTTAALSVFGSGDRPVRVLPGQVYEFQGSATDAFNNVTATVVGRTRAVVPFDQTRATFVSTAKTVTAGYRWLGSSTVLYKAGQIANLTNVTGNRLQVVGDKSTTGGSFAVYLKYGDGSYSKLGRTVSTYATSTRVRQVLYTYAFTTSAPRTYQVRWSPSSTSTRKNVVLDAFAVRR